MRVVVSIAGSDSSAGAGIQADIKAIAANGAYAASVLTAITAQNTVGVQSAYPLPVDVVRAQIASVFDDLDVAGVKTGMLGDAQMILAIADELRSRQPGFVVLDPVMISKTGFPLLEQAAVATLREQLLPLATVVTPNVHEAESLTGLSVRSVADAERAGQALLEMGCRAALIKGGHLEEAPATDVLVTRDGVDVIAGEWVESRHTHGTGCTYASSIAARLALGEPLPAAVRSAKIYVTEAIRAGLAIGAGVGPTDHFWMLRTVAPK